MDTLDPQQYDDNSGIPVYIVQPKDEEGNPIGLFFAVTENGLLIHMQQMEEEIPKHVVADEMGKMLFGLESSSGKYTEFIKNPDHYEIKMKVVSPFTLAQAKELNSYYYMKSEDRIRKLEKDKAAWTG
jgi:hypothetical protein